MCINGENAKMKEIYKEKGYSDNWIEKRVRGIAIRDELTDEWDNRGIEASKEYSILTAEISRATFGMTPTEYKKYLGNYIGLDILKIC